MHSRIRELINKCFCIVGLSNCPVSFQLIKVIFLIIKFPFTYPQRVDPDMKSERPICLTL
jgi:hypothetical protein